MSTANEVVRRVAGCGLFLLVVAGCAPLMGRSARGGGAGLADKPVASKESPTALLAADGTRCLVTEEKYRNTALGERVWCFWSYDGDRPATSEGTPPVASGARPAGATPVERRPAASRRPSPVVKPQSSR
jgi:hypothetical protein